MTAGAGRGAEGRRSKGDASLGNRQELSYPLKIKQLRLPCVPPASPSLNPGAPVGKAWRDAGRTGRGCSGCGYRPRYAGIQAGKYAGEITCLLGRGGGDQRGREGCQIVRPLIRCDQASTRAADD